MTPRDTNDRANYKALKMTYAISGGPGTGRDLAISPAVTPWAPYLPAAPVVTAGCDATGCLVQPESLGLCGALALATRLPPGLS